MELVTYPSESCPGPPRVRLGLPDGWTVVSAPGVAFMAFLDSGLPDVFTTNTVVTVRRVGSSVSLDQVMADTGLELASLRDYAELTATTAEINERDVGIREYGFTDESESATVFQLQAIALVSVNALVSDVVTVTISHGAEHLEDEIDGLREIVRSLSIEDPPGAEA